MGFSTGNENSLPTTFFKMNGLAKGSTEIFFEGTVKQGDAYVTIDAKPNNLFGHLTGVSVKEFEFEGKKHKAVRIVIDSATERVILEGGFSNVMVGLINTLAGNKEAIDKIALSVYISKKGYQSMGIIINGGTWEDNDWKFDYNKDLKPLIDVTLNKKKEAVAWDKSALIDFLTKEIESDEFQAKIKGTPPAQAPVQVIEQDSVSAPDAPAEDDDLPF
jgi:hypothetical protein